MNYVSNRMTFCIMAKGHIPRKLRNQGSLQCILQFAGTEYINLTLQQPLRLLLKDPN